MQDLAARGHDWHYYDEYFWYLRQNQPSAFPWGVIHWKLWMRSQQPVSKKQSLPGNSFRSRLSESSIVPKGYCFKFYKGAQCAGCSFKHSCPKCEGANRMSICTFVPNQSNHQERLPMPNPQEPNPHLPTPVKFSRLLYLLSGYNHSTVMFLSDGFTHCFPLHFQGIRESSHAKSLLSAVQNPTVVDAKIAKELAAGRLAGPFDSPPISPSVVSPLDVVPKKSAGEFRLIHHLSFPKGASVNDGISHENSTVCYATIGDAIR